MLVKLPEDTQSLQFYAIEYMNELIRGKTLKAMRNRFIRKRKSVGE